MKNSKNLSIIVILVFTFFVGLLPANAEEVTYLYGSAAGNISINSTTNTTSGIGVMPLGAKVRITDTTKYSATGDCPKMYKIDYLGTKGYVCSSTTSLFKINTTSTSNFTNFPDTYRPYLQSIKNIYPNAQFIPIKNNIVWKDVVDNQTDAEGKNLIQITKKDRDGWKNPTTYIDGKFKNDFSGGGINWFSPSREIVSYYLDPRNFLNEVHIFMFEQLSYIKGTHNIEGVKSIIHKTFMENTTIKDSNGNDITYAKAFMEAAEASNVSPYHLAARVVQELGSNGNKLPVISGTVSGYENLFNYYNINANGDNVVTKALNFARGGSSNSTTYDRPWNTPYKALIGGAKFISGDYISVGQDTNYTQKFDIVGDLYSHQYMQNIQAPASETIKSFKNGTQKITDYQNLHYVFKIPVYLDMPNETSLPNPKLDISSLPTTPPAPPAPVINYGDVNNDGQITVLDLLYVQRYLLRTMTLNPQQLKAADVSKDGVVNVLDLLMIQKHLLGISFIR